jgi:hypothetical protein
MPISVWGMKEVCSGIKANAKADATEVIETTRLSMYNFIGPFLGK